MTADWLVQTFFVAGSPGAFFVQLATLITLIVLSLLAATELPSLISWARSESRVAGGLFALMALGAALRLAAPASQMDIHYRLSAAEVHVSLAKSAYGLAFGSVVRSLWWLTGPSDASVHNFNVVAGVVSIGLLFALARALGLSTIGAFAAAALLAFNPTHAIFSHTDNQTILEIALTLWGIRSLVVPTGPRQRLIAGLALGLAAVLRPDALAVIAVAIVVWALVGRPLSRWDGLLAVGLVLVAPNLAAWAGLAMDGSTMSQAFTRDVVSQYGWRHFLFLRMEWSHWLVPIGMALAFFDVDRRRLVVGTALIALALSVAVPGFSLAALAHAGARHQLRAIPFAAVWGAIGLAWAVAKLEERTPAAVPIAVFAGALATVPVVPYTVAQTSLSAEYALYRDHITEVPRGCQIIGFFDMLSSDLSLKPPRQLSRQLELDHRWIDLELEPMPEDGCRVYFRGASCYASGVTKAYAEQSSDGALEAQERCRLAEARLNLEPLHVENIIGRSHGTDHYPPESHMEVGFFTVRGAR